MITVSQKNLNCFISEKYNAFYFIKIYILIISHCDSNLCDLTWVDIFKINYYG